MKRYEVVKASHVYYTAIVEAESEAEAENIMENVDINDCFGEETCTYLHRIEEFNGSDEEHSFPVIYKTENGYGVR